MPEIDCVPRIDTAGLDLHDALCRYIHQQRYQVRRYHSMPSRAMYELSSQTQACMRAVCDELQRIVEAVAEAEDEHNAQAPAARASA